MNTLALEHVGIAVEAPDAAGRLFEKILGGRRYKQETVGDQGVRTHFLPAGAAKLELLEVLGPESPVARFLEKRGEGVHHLAFEVTDIEAAMDRMRHLGLTPLSDAPRPGADGKRIFFLHPKDTCGVLVEFCQSTPVPLEMTRVPYRNGHLAVYEMGAPANPALVMLHGAIGSTQRETASLARRLAPHFHVLALDFSGHGASTDAGPFSADLFADNVRTVLDHFGVERAHLFGFSMGGYAALHFAAHYPKRTICLAVHGTSIAWDAATVNAMKGRFPAAETLEKTSENKQRLFERTTRFIRMLPGQTEVMEAVLPRVEAPVLVSAADRDNLFPLEAALRLQGLLPQSRLAVLPGARHALTALDLDVYVPLLRRHFENAEVNNHPQGEQGGT